MLRSEKILLAAAAFFLVSCSDVSQMCRHNNNYLSQFLRMRQTETSMPMSTIDIKSTRTFEDTLTINWKLLSDVTFDKKYDEKLKMPMLYPSFSRNVKALHGKLVTISGYVIPLDVKGGMYVLSANPNNSCFFCGGAGPESVIALKFKTGKPSFQTDDFVKCKGRLRLNEKNIYELYYNLDEVTLVGK